LSTPVSARPRVIGVSGPVGAGKSTLARDLAAGLGASLIQFDDYETHTLRPIGEIRAWLDGGADLDEIRIPRLAEDLRALKSGIPVAHPATGRRIEPGEYLLFETQFGRQHAATGRFIDFLVWIETPLDIALARKIRQFADDAKENGGALAPWLHEYLGNYISVVGDLLRIQGRTVPADADLVVDGALSPSEVLSRAEREIRAHFARGLTL
jgi:uridine kinase